MLGRRARPPVPAHGPRKSGLTEMDEPRGVWALEQFCRYMTRPAMANEIIQTNAAGQVVPQPTHCNQSEAVIVDL